MATNCYFELRKSNARGTDSMLADTMRHLYTRQHLGKAVIVCDQPMGALGAARKQWLKLSRILQKRRSSTLNADKILKYTHAITRMQHMHFTIKTPLERPEADVYFLIPDDLDFLPVQCWSTYVLCATPRETAASLSDQLPADALVIDYGQSGIWPKLGLQPKKTLEAKVTVQWRRVHKYLLDHDINITKFVTDGIYDVNVMDDALDTLLGGHTHNFLQIANEFQRALELARPLRLSKPVRSSYDSLVLLAHRVQALSPIAFSQHFLETYSEDDTFFLYDAGRTRQNLLTGGETLAEAFNRHTLADRHHLAKSFQKLAETAG